MKVSFSLAKAKVDKPLGEAPSLKRPASLNPFGDEDPSDSITGPMAATAKATPNKTLVAQSSEQSKTTRKRAGEELKVDSIIYEYDEVWDSMQDAKLKQKIVKEADAKERKPKYISGLLSTAATRRIDHLRAEEKMIQREREAEGDEFADKEAFVTQAYKDQIAEVRRAEQEEKEKDEREKKSKGSLGTGMAHFYRQLLKESEQQHEKTVAAASFSKPPIGPQGPTPSLTITKPANTAPKSDVELARLAREQGKEVELNDDNQIVDKRDLLSAGLNLSAPNTRQLGLQSSTYNASAEVVSTHRAVGSAASRREINERREQEISTQLEEERQRLVEEQRKREQDEINRIVAKRNTEETLQSARERYLARKRRKLEEFDDLQ